MRLRFILHTTLAFSSILALATAGFVVLFPLTATSDLATVSAAESESETNQTVLVSVQDTEEPPARPASSASIIASASENVAGASVSRFATPMTDAALRVTMKPFGIFIDPEHSPVPNDTKHGFHVGVDFEVFEYEMIADVPVFAVCPGPLRLKTWAKGYGGVAVQECAVDGRLMTVIYGHLDVATVSAAHGHVYGVGELVGFLGDGHSHETDDVRKHLHLGLREGPAVDEEKHWNIKGYVKTEDDVSRWIDARAYMEL